jgi:hypothetical protein
VAVRRSNHSARSHPQASAENIKELTVIYVLSGLSTALLTFILLILLLALVYIYFKRKVKNQTELNLGGYKEMSSIVADQ